MTRAAIKVLLWASGALVLVAAVGALVMTFFIGPWPFIGACALTGLAGLFAAGVLAEGEVETGITTEPPYLTRRKKVAR